MGFELPKDFEDKMKSYLGDEWEDFRYSYENNRYQALRINTLKVDPLQNGYDTELMRILGDVGITAKEPVEWAKEGYYYDEKSRPGKHPFHEMGLYYIQEPSAMSPAALLAPTPGMRVLDLCAAPGGKSTQLASYLKGEGLLISNEINNARCKILSQNIERMGIGNALVVNEDSYRLAEVFPGYFQAIMVDAPCSGEGMFRKNPEAMDEWSLENVAICAARQLEILDNADVMLAPGGSIVYSTCTFSHEENEDVIEAFLKKHSDYELIESHRFMPHKVKGEGHFAAKLLKSGNLIIPESDRKSSKKSKLSKEQETLLKEFLNDIVEKDVADWVMSGELVLFKDQLYRLPDMAPDIRGLHVLRAGLHIGEYKSKRFEPAYAFALFLGADKVKKVADIASADERAWGYFEGLAVFMREDELSPKAKGWHLLTIDSYPAGWTKASNGQLKNHYPKGLRKKLK